MITLKIILISATILISFVTSNPAYAKSEPIKLLENNTEKRKTPRRVAFRVLGLMKTKSGAT
jgi:hypothetical protein